MNNIETMKQWLEALELSHPRFGVGTAIHIKAVATLRQAIEQAQQAQPVVGVFDYKEHAEGLQRDYDLLLAEYNDLKAQQTEPVATNDTSQERVDETAKQRHEPCGLECDCTDVCKQDNYKALWQQMCERCDALDKQLAQQAEPIGASEETQRFAIQVEKMLCEKLGRKWSPSGISIQTLVDELADRKAQQAEPDYYGLTKDHLWMSITKDHYDMLKPEFRMACYTSPPPRQPLTMWTEAQHERAYQNSSELHEDVKSLAAFKRVAKKIAAMYGIKEKNNG